MADQNAILSKITELNSYVTTVEEKINEIKALRGGGVEGLNQKLTKFFTLLAHTYQQQSEFQTLKDQTNSNEDQNQDQQELKSRIEEMEEKLHQIREEVLGLNVGNLEELETMVEVFCPEAITRDGDWSSHHLYHYMSLWHKEAEKGRKRGNISFMELLNYKPLWNNAARLLGIRLSYLTIDFLMSSYHRFGLRPLVSRFQSTLDHLIMEEKEESLIIDSSLHVLDSVEIKSWEFSGQEQDPRFWGESLNRREKHIGISIIQEILYLEVVFCCPIFPMRYLKLETLYAFVNYLRARVTQKEKSIRAEIKEKEKEFPEPEDPLFPPAFKTALYEMVGPAWAD